MFTDSITIIVKPTSECNFRCKYCYHASTNYEAGILDVEKLEKLIRLAQKEYDQVEYIWHGGEPLLCGIEYFERIVALQQQQQRPDLAIINSVQTNGLLLDRQYIHFFKKNNFSVSISLDGPGDCNALRQSTDRVIQNLNAGRKAGLRLSALSVIHAGNFDRQIEMYEFFKSNNLPMKFNPIFRSGSATHNPEYLLETQPYIDSLKAFYDYWLFDPSAVRVEPLDQYLHMKLTGRGTDCIYGSCLYRWIGVDHHGDIYPCGRSFGEDCRIGSLSEIGQLGDLFLHPNYVALLKNSILRRIACQNGCAYYGLCNGGCNNNALIENGRMDVNGGFLCEVLKEMYDYVSKSIDTILDESVSLEKYNPIIRQILNKKKLSEVFE